MLPSLLTSYWLPRPPPPVRLPLAVAARASAATAASARNHLISHLLSRWNRGQGAVDRVYGAGDVGGVVGAEEDDELPDLGRLAEPVHRHDVEVELLVDRSTRDVGVPHRGPQHAG